MSQNRHRNPRVTIGVPVYNGEAFIAATLESLIQQTFQDWEIVISDNASTDGTAALCRRYAAQDPRIRYTRNAANVGSARNFNRTVELAAGEYFKLANADDLAGPELVTKCVEVLDDRPEVVLCYGKTMLIDGDGRVTREYDDRLDLRSPDPADRFRHAVQDIGLVNVLQGVMRTEALRKTGCLGSYVGSDVVLVGELALHGQFFELPERLFFRRIHAGALSRQPTLEGQLDFVDPGRRGALVLPVARGYVGYWKAIMRSPLPVSKKLGLVGWLLNQAVQARQELLHEVTSAVRGRVRPYFRSRST
jgi:glycosyltransferase involved in cell wall biosynthesis